MLRWINENTQKDKIRNEEIILKVGNRDSPYWWKDESELIQVEGMKKCEGKPKITLVEVINKIKNKDMSIRETRESMTQMK